MPKSLLITLDGHKVSGKVQEVAVGSGRVMEDLEGSGKVLQRVVS